MIAIHAIHRGTRYWVPTREKIVHKISNLPSTLVDTYEIYAIVIYTQKTKGSFV